MKTKAIALSVLACAMLAGVANTPAMAQNTNTPGIDRAQEEISARIQQGISSGRITRSEADALTQRERELRKRETRMKADGRASPGEREQLRNDLQALRDEVERAINNPRNAGGGANTPGIDNAEYQARARIEQGVSSGHIRSWEARRLNQRLRDIERMERRFKADGVVSRYERRRLRSEIASLRDDIEAKISDNRRGRR